jgi:predicted PurR-regulated permease PerM
MVIQRIGFYVLLVLVTVAFFWLLLPYYSAILWAVILAIVFYPMQAWLTAAFGGRNGLAAFVSVMVCICLVIVPTLVLLGSLIQEGNGVYARISNREFDLNGYLTQIEAALPTWLTSWMESMRFADFTELRQRLGEAGMQASQLFASSVLSLGQNALGFVVSVGIMLYLLFFLFKDGATLGSTIRRAIPLSDGYTHQFLDKFAAVIRATVKGNIIIAALQGALGGVTFWMLGIQAAVLWGVVMAFFSMLPAVGAAFVWGPVAIYYAVTGQWVSATILTLVGVLIIGMVDNLLRPPLVGKGTRLPDYVVLISTVGGMSMVGINGFVVGPLIAALFFSAWSLFVQEQAKL